MVLDLEDNFTTGMARAAAAAATLNKELNSLSGSSVRSRGVDKAATDIDRVGTSARRAGPDIDRFSGRLTLLRDAALLIGPAFIPLGAVAVPAIAGLAAQMGAAALAGGTVIAAFQGMGEALKAVNKAALEPTAENLAAARLAMQELSPQAQDLVKQIQDLQPALLELRDAAGSGLFPGVGEALADLSSVLPNIERLLNGVGNAAGLVAEEFGEGIAGPRGREFIDFLADEVPSALVDMGRTIGNVTAGMAELWMAFTPLNRDFSDWLLDATRGFDDWAQGLSETDGFREFVAYLQRTGPQLADAMGAVGNAVLQVVEAASGFAGPALGALEAVANLIAVIANSPAGPALLALATGMTLVSRASKALDAIRGSQLFASIGTDASGAARSMSTLQKASLGAGAGLSALVLGATAIREIQEATDDAIPGVEELTSKLLNVGSEPIGQFDDISESLKRILDPGALTGFSDKLQTPFEGLFGEAGSLRVARDELAALDEAFAGLVTDAGPEKAAETLREFGDYNQLSAEQMQQLVSQLPQYREALARVGNAAQIAGEESADGFIRATTAAQRFREAVIAANNALTGRASMRDYEQALDDFADTLDNVGNAARLVNKNGKINIDLPKGRELQTTLDGIATAALAVAENMRGTNKIQFLQSARGDMIAAARQLGLTREQAAALADRLLGLNKLNIKPRVGIDTRAALAGIGVVTNGLNDVDAKRPNPRVTLDYSDVQAGINAVTSLLNSVSGRSVNTTVTTTYQTRGNIPGRPGLATGGYVSGPGTGTSDDIPAWLSNGEFVLRAAAVQRYGVDFLHQLNAMRFAQGGLVSSQVQRQPSRPSSVSVSAPAVSVGGPAVRVFIDGSEVRAIVRSEQASQARYDRRLEDR